MYAYKHLYSKTLCKKHPISFMETHYVPLNNNNNKLKLILTLQIIVDSLEINYCGRILLKICDVPRMGSFAIIIIIIVFIITILGFFSHPEIFAVRSNSDNEFDCVVSVYK